MDVALQNVLSDLFIVTVTAGLLLVALVDFFH